MTILRRLDHVAVVVSNTAEALRFYRDRLGLRVASTEELAEPPVRLTYLDAGNAYVQLVEPLAADSPVAEWLDSHGEGLHHLCFGVDDVVRATVELNDDGVASKLGSGRGRVSGFVRTNASYGVLVECTEFVKAEDVDTRHGWLLPGHAGEKL